jgi:protein-S-isoprenylcysteine O-methyltransferase Ste14
VLTELIALAGLVTYSSIPGLNGWADGVSALGILLGAWAFFVMMGASRFSIFPEVTKGTKLVTSGPYRLMRHPMYVALLLYAAGRLINNYNTMTVFFSILLVATLTIKVHVEEKFLKKAFPKYRQYAKTTARFIPWVY